MKSEVKGKTIVRKLLSGDRKKGRPRLSDILNGKKIKVKVKKVVKKKVAKKVVTKKKKVKKSKS